MANFDKVIVTNESALRQKYGAKVARVKEALRYLVAADKKRGLRTKVVAIDSAVAMKKLGGPVTRVDSCRQCKRAIDAVYAAFNPDYLMILGSIDVIPHQDLANPVFNVGGDDEDLDKEAPGDLPYACNAPYSNKPERFKGPTRVVGRLPDLNGESDPAYLVRVIRSAANARSRPFADYAAHLGISAKVWRNSTKLSMSKLFGPAASVELSPTAGPKWPAAKLKARSHFINCHGAPADTYYYGEGSSGNQPEAHDAAWLEGRITEGTVAAAECCYGAELYDPKLTNGQPGICHTYLGNGAYGVFGSSTIAYGPEEGNGSADLITQFFLKRVLEGASLGRAALEARQDFVRSAATLDPIDLKTLAQFSLMGDPSIQPVQTTRGYETPLNAIGKAVPGKKKARRAAAKTPVEGPSDKAARALRRSRLAHAGEAVGKAVMHVVSGSQRATSADAKRLLAQEARRSGIKARGFASFSVTGPSTAPATTSLKKSAKSAKSAKIETKRSVHMTIGASHSSRKGVKNLVAIVVTEWDGQRVVRKLYSR